MGIRYSKSISLAFWWRVIIKKKLKKCGKGGRGLRYYTFHKIGIKGHICFDFKLLTIFHDISNESLREIIRFGTEFTKMFVKYRLISVFKLFLKISVSFSQFLRCDMGGERLKMSRNEVRSFLYVLN